MLHSLVDNAETALPIMLLRPEEAKEAAQVPEERWRRWAKASGFEGKSGQFCLLPDPDGNPEAVLAGFDPAELPWCLADMAGALPAGAYRLRVDLDPWTAGQCALGWALAHYSFDRYKTQPTKGARLVWPQSVDRGEVLRKANAVRLVRDLINTPAEDMGPSALAEAALEVAKAMG